MAQPQAQKAGIRSRRRARFTTVLAWLSGSLALHATLFLLLGLGSIRRTELPIRLPLELEIGIGESEDKELGGAAEAEGKRSQERNEQGHDAQTKVAHKAVPTPARAVPEMIASAPVKTASADVTSSADAGVASAADASVTDEQNQLAGSGTADAGPTGPRRGIGGGDGSGFGINGALLALRIDVASVRKSALILETEALLSIVPGWQRMFGGSGLVPLSHFKRFVIATPNLHPSRLSMAATMRNGLRGVDALKARAAHQGPLRQEHDATIGLWSKRGNTTREIAFLNDSAFTISRAQDVSRLLALAHVIGNQIDAPDRDPDPVLAGLLHMDATEALSLNVHHVSAFVPESVSQGARLPQRLRFVLDQPTQFAVQLHVIGDYASSEQADLALSQWRRTYDDIATRPDVAAFGLVGAIEHATFAREDHEVHARTQLTMSQLRYLLGLLRDLLQALVPTSGEGLP